MTETKNGGAAGDRIRHFIDRAWNLEEEKAEVMGDFREDLKAVYDQAAAEGFNAQALKEVIGLKKKARKRGQSFIDDYDLYRHAAGLEGTPLDLAAKRKEREDTDEDLDAEIVDPPTPPPPTVAVTGTRRKQLPAPPKSLTAPKTH